MPPHQRPSASNLSSGPSSNNPQGPPVGYGASMPMPNSPQDLLNDIRALNSGLMVLGQRFQSLVRNEKMLSQSFLVLSKKLETVSADVHSGKSTEGGVSLPELDSMKRDLNSAAAELSSLREQVGELTDRLNRLSESFASREDLAEIKYVVNAINPLEFVTVKQVDLLIERKVKEALEKSSNKK